MKQSAFAESPIDHYIQREILQALFKSKAAVAFSDLKPDAIDNSLFMYHMRKLTDRGLVEKLDEGYRLTPDGARRVNFVSSDTLRPDLNPRVLVSFLIFNQDASRVLLSRRIGVASEHLGEYLIPAGRARYGMSLEASARERVEGLFGAEVSLKSIGQYETIITLSDGYIHHTISFAHTAVLGEAQVFPREDTYELVWADVDAILGGEFGEVVRGIVRHAQQSGIFEHALFTISL